MNPSIMRLAHGTWRVLPRTFRRNALSAVAARLAPRPGAPPAASGSVVVAGDITGTNGLAATARILYQAMASHGLAEKKIPLGLPGVTPAFRGTLPETAALLAVVNAPILPAALLRLPRKTLRGRRVIGMWAWELPIVPASWHYGAKFVHEIWAPSPFTAAALEAAAPGRVRVVPYPLAAIPLPATGTRADFGLPAQKLIVLTALNLASSMARKNPLGAIAAFKAAFGARPDFLLLLKISGFEAYPRDLALIRAAIANAPNIRLITATFPEAALRGLIAASDIILSLHRAEGFGLIPATAMLLGRPVVATGWSGNLAYMTEQNSALVSYRLIPAKDDRGVYQLPGAYWAEPDIADAAWHLRWLAEESSARTALGAAGQRDAAKTLSAQPLLAALAANGVKPGPAALSRHAGESRHPQLASTTRPFLV
jgi:glycosyltransferase involved in cell wall biosynthesis